MLEYTFCKLTTDLGMHTEEISSILKMRDTKRLLENWSGNNRLMKMNL